MRVLCDENIPHGLRGLLPEHDVVTVAYLNWTGIKNSELLKAAEEAGFDVLITSDQGIPHQQHDGAQTRHDYDIHARLEHSETCGHEDC